MLLVKRGRQKEQGGPEMKGSDHWERFFNTGKIEDYLKWKEEIKGTIGMKEGTGEYSHAGTHKSNRDSIKGISRGGL